MTTTNPIFRDLFKLKPIIAYNIDCKQGEDWLNDKLIKVSE